MGDAGWLHAPVTNQRTPYQGQDQHRRVKMVVMLRQCCCGCSLKTGSSIISVTDATIGLLSLVLAIAGPEFAKDFHGMFEVVIASGVTGAILLTVSILMFFGARSGHLRYLLPWLLYGCLYIVLSFIQHLVFAVTNFSHGQFEVGVGFVVVLLIHECLQVYSLLVVYSYYRDLKGETPTIP
ncbi:uncharacterized protein LOC111862041 [Cryptotermes secundus]|uniref:uncharacterized protein LOC111862041 n=1 Tax=Cryptotermes secundus TaxID=105785 RepID=UPI000CD7DB35|nr:uncharacterized protein LOC111862041 [Cryptotermes secundus]